MTEPALEPPSDQAARDTAVQVLDHNVFVEAGAGSGKTTLLVARVVALVADGTPIEQIAAITFTERAALELRDRLRTAFTARARADGADGRWRDAVTGLDAAAIGTIHAFAQRILADHWRPAGLPPRFTVADDAASALAFEQRWRALAARLFRAPEGPGDELARAVRLALAARVSTAHVRQLVKALDESWDLAGEHLQGPAAPVPPLPLEPILAELDTLVALADASRAPDDLLARHLAGLGRLREALRTQPDDAGQLAVLVDAKVAFRNGRANNWSHVPGGKDEIHARLDRLHGELIALRDRVQHACLQQLAVAVATEVAAASRRRRRIGQLEFHDLLVMTRDLLRDPRHGPTVRAGLHERFRQLLLDEFQDTDPIQLEIAVLIAADPAAPPDPLPLPEPGRVFFVGDPKQSIYRFRRADISTYLGARATYGEPTVALNVNFRSTRGVIEWVNRVFRRLVQERDGSQAAYRPLKAVRASLAGPAVVTIGDEHPDDPDADELRAREAADVAVVLSSAIGSWHVRDDHGGSRPARASDVAILIPTRTVLPALEDALHELGVPVRVEAGSLLFGGDEIAEVLTLVRAVVHPDDELSVLAALRTTLLGVSEVDLYRHRVPERRDFDPRLPHDPEGSPVDHALADLGRWHALAAYASPSAVLGALLADRRGWELAAGHARGRDALRRLRVLVEAARGFADDSAGTLADWLAWIDRQRSDGARWSEPLVPEPDDDAVRILTIHAAKGLEFPIVVVTGLTGRPGGRPTSTKVLWPRQPGPPEIKLATGLTSASYDDAADLDAQLDDDERVRLLYVACTRAQDHLVVSQHRTTTGSGTRTLAALLAGANPEGTGAEAFAQQGLPFGLTPPPPVTPLATPPPAHPPTLPPVVSATTLVGLLTGEPLDDAGAGASRATVVDPSGNGNVDPDDDDDGDVDPVLDRAGTPSGSAFGRAVHAVLERVTLAGADTVVPADLADDAARAEGLADDAHHVAAAALAAARVQVVAAAAHLPHWRELYVAVPIGELLVEGYIDLLVRMPEGLVVVDYKTDAHPPTDGGVHPKHRLQLAVYAHAVAHATGEPVVAAYAVYVRDETNAQRGVPDLAAAVAEITVPPAARARP